MGKSKKASAAAAAAALEKAGFGGFVGFDAFSTTETQAAEESETVASFYEGDVESLKSAFKALGKKDAQTKLKSLGEVSQALEGLSKVQARVALRHYLYHYLRVCSKESDNRVREKANASLQAFVEKVPKIARKASHAFLGELLCCVQDSTSQEVRRSALSCLESVAPKEASERVQWLEECTQSLGRFLKNRIDKSDPLQSDTAIAEKLQANAVGALVAFTRFAPRESTENLLVSTFPTGCSDALRRLLSNKSVLVRSAAFELVEGIANKQIKTVAGKALFTQETVNQVLKGLAKEQEVDVVRRLVECILSLMACLKDDFFLVADWAKLFFPGMWNLLREAARGAGSRVYPCILPMVALVPDHVAKAFEEQGSLPLCSKWLEELAAGIKNQERLGPHNMPVLLETILECMALFLKNGQSPGFAVFHQVLEFFVCEPRRYMVGNQLPARFRLCFSHIKEESSEWSTLEELCLDLFTRGAAESLRLAQLLCPSIEISRVKSITAQVVRTYCMEPDLSNVSLETLYLLVGADRSLAVLVDANDLLNRILCPSVADAGKNTQNMALKLLVRLLVVGHAPESAWSRALEVFVPPYADQRAWRIQLYAFCDKLGHALAEAVSCEDSPVDDVVEFVLQHPTCGSVSALHRVRWLSEDVKQCLVSNALQQVSQVVQNVYFAKSSPMDLEDPFLEETVRLCQMKELHQDGSEEQRIELVCKSCIVAALLGVERLSHVPSATTYQEWMSCWLRDTLCGPGEDWVEEPYASKGWAHLSVQLGLSQRLLSSLRPDQLYSRKIVQVAMHISEEKEEGSLLGFVEPPELLWALVRSSSSEKDWRDAVLSPYIAGDAERFTSVISHGLKHDVQHIQSCGPILSRASLVLGESFDATVKDVIFPAMVQVTTQVQVLDTVVKSTSESLARLGLLPKLGSFWANLVLEMLPQERRAQCVELAESFVSLLREHETQTIEEEHSTNPTHQAVEGVQSDHEDGEEDEDVGEEPLQPPETETFEEDEPILYIKSEKPVPGLIRAVHRDDPSALYYTVLLENGREVQTTGSNLKPKHVKPKTLEELNHLLALARRAGDHKESLRLMKLQPSLVPKPVDSDQARKEALEAARRRRQRALEHLASIKKQGSLGQQVSSGAQVGSGVGDSVPGTSGSLLGTKEASRETQRRLDCFSAIFPPERAAKFENEELRNLLVVASSLQVILNPRMVALFFQRMDASDPLEEILLCCLRILRALTANLRDDVIPGEIAAYMNRVVGSCFASKQREDLRFVHLGFEIVANLGDEGELQETAAELLLDLAIQHPTALSPLMMERLRNNTPVTLIEQYESERDASLLCVLVQSEHNQTKLALLDLFGSCCKESDNIVRVWWSKSDLLFSALEERVVEQDGDEESQDELSFDFAVWCMALHLVRRIRVLEPSLRDEISERIETLNVAEEALHWSLLSDRFGHDSIRKTVASLTLRVLPALSRRWYTDSNNVNRSDYVLVRDRLSKYVTPQIVVEEMKDLNFAVEMHAFDVRPEEGGEEEEGGTLSIMTSIKARSVSAVYEKEDCVVEIKIVLPAAFPLQNVEVQGVREVGIKAERWRRMTLQISTMLTTQDATLTDAILFWKFNMDKELEGMEPCPICYAVVHANDQSLPKLRCSTCKNCFHAKCLVKWFKTSHKNDCPLCKQPF